MAEIGISCATCSCYIPAPNGKAGVCRANPPQVLIVGAQKNPITGDVQPLTKAAWPVVGADEWCGRHPAFGAAMTVPIDKRLAANADGEA